MVSSIYREVIVINSKGLHARPASMIAKAVSSLDSTVTVIRGKDEADAKSILSLLILAAGKGTNLTIQASGADKEHALDELEQLFLNRFNEE